MWMNGSSTINQNGTYGTQGVYSASNTPGGRWGAITWKDASGIFWFFGGEGYASTGGAGRTSDLWKYDPSINQWMWVKGPNTIDNNGTYGSKGVAAAGNNPGAREVADNWIDNSGNFWIFGGFGRAASGGNNYLNDLWKYNPSTNQWTWMSGDSTGAVKGVYGTKGTASASNKPGARYHSVGTLDASGNLLMFSGAGYAQSTVIPGNLSLTFFYKIKLFLCNIMNILKKIFLLLLITLAGIQFFHPKKNISAEASSSHISKKYSVPDDVRQILSASCYDCHSNNTNYPWYFSVQPVAWWLNDHIEEGKEHLNFDEFSSYSPRRQFRKFEQIKEEVEENEMPLESYTLMHPNAELSPEKVQKLVLWSEMQMDKMKSEYPPDSLMKKKQ